MLPLARRLWKYLMALCCGSFEPSLGQALRPMAVPADTLRVVIQITKPLVFLILPFALAARAFGFTLPYWLIGLLAILMLGLTTVEARVLRRPEYLREDLARRLGVAHLGMTLGVITVAIGASGGVQSPFVWLYGMDIAIEAILRGRRWALPATAASVVLLVSATGLVRAGLAPNQPALWPAGTTIAFLISYTGMFLAIAMALSGLGVYLRRQSQEIVGLTSDLRESYLGTIRALVEADGTVLVKAGPEADQRND